MDTAQSWPSLMALHMAVQQRLMREVPALHAGYGYWPLTERFQKVQQGLYSLNPDGDKIALEADLLRLVDADPNLLRRMVQHNAASADCIPPHTALAMRSTTAEQERLAAHNARHARPNPAELLRGFMARGFTITKGQDGHLHVRPAEWLTEADRTVLAANKAHLIAVLDGAPA